MVSGAVSGDKFTFFCESLLLPRTRCLINRYLHAVSGHADQEYLFEDGQDRGQDEGDLHFVVKMSLLQSTFGLQRLSQAI